MSTKEENNSWQEGEASSGEGSPDGRSRPDKMKRNCGKWWWLYFLSLILAVVVIVIPIVFVAIKKIAQKELNKATITVNQQLIGAPGENAFDLQFNTTLATNQGHQAIVQGFNQSFFLLDTLPNPIPFMYADVPTSEFPEAVAANTPSITVNISSPRTMIANASEFGRYMSLVRNSANFSIGVRGNTHMILSQLPKYSVTYDKTIQMKGFNNFQGFQFTNVQFYPFLPQFDGATMTAYASIPNPSVIHVQFGNVTMDLYSSNNYLGYVLLQYFDYQHGSNLVSARGYFNISSALQYAQNNQLSVELRGNSSVNIGGQHIPYFEDLFKSNVIQYTLNLTSAGG